MNDLAINANLALVFRGDVLEIKEVAKSIEDILKKHPGIKLIHKQISMGKLWIKEGDGMNDRASSL